jgi:diguanylate cyclase (GGDEF)-like protein
MSADRQSEFADQQPSDDGADDSCAITALLLDRVYELGGDVAVGLVLRRAGSGRSRAYLRDPSNWISLAESVALWEAATNVTHQRSLARSVGATVARQLWTTPGGEPLRSAASPEEALARLAETLSQSTRSVTASVRDCRPGFVEVVHRPPDGVSRSAHQCDWSLGLFEQTVALLELRSASVEHETCAAFGAPECRYRMVWRAQASDGEPEPPHTVSRLRAELDAMRERLHAVFDTAADLVGPGHVDDALARIAARGAQEIGGGRYLLAVQAGAEQPPQVHGHGFDATEIERLLGCLRAGQEPEPEPSWLTVPIRSDERDYGFLIVEPPAVRSRFEDRELLEVYARYAAIALDSAAARMRAEHRFKQTTALLEFAREVSAAGTSGEVAQRLADSVGLVVECDEVAVHLWDGAQFTLLGYRDYRGHRDPPPQLPRSWQPQPAGVVSRFVSDPQLAPVFLSLDTDRRTDRLSVGKLGLEASIAVPLAGTDRLLGVMFIAVLERAERLRPTPELTAQIEGVVAQATTTLENGRLMDVVVHQARHDQLTGLGNRVQFADDLQAAIARARAEQELVGLFYMDLDQFKPVNDDFGHDTGDELLAAVAARLSAATRGHTREHMYLARLGGDEFALVTNAVGTSELELVNRRLRDLFDEPFEVGGRQLSLTVSVGRSVFPTDAPDADGLVRIADAAMYLDKSAPSERRSERGDHD